MQQTFKYVLLQGDEVAKEFNKRMELETRPFTQKTTESGVIYVIREEV